MKLSAIQRDQLLRKASEETYDLIIIGGGITGAGIALDATLRGLKCILFEMQDFSAGTSSRSTKLVHGGLRYLKQLEFGLVREVGLERAVVYNNARHVVRAEKMLLPIIKNGSLGKLSSSLALSVYDFLADVEKSERRKMLSKKETLQAEPLLEESKLLGGGLYYEYRSDDARLTIEIMKTAAENGAKCFNYTKVTDFLYDENQDVISGVSISDIKSGENFQFKAKKIVNAAGPWVDKLRKIDGVVSGKRLQLTKGVHLVIEREKLKIQQATYFDVGDGRMIFAIPRNEIVYLGTTDTVYTNQIERPKVTSNDVSYILAACNRMFPSAQLKTEDVISTWAGLRPLIYEEGKSASELSRKDEIFYADSGLISIAGGKLTGYRKMAERIVDIVAKQLETETQVKYKACATELQKLSGGDFNCEKCLTKTLKETTEKLETFGLKEKFAKNLVFRYGSNCPGIIEKLEQIDNQHTNYSPKEKLILAELHYCVENEMVGTLSDFLVRRTGRLYFERQTILDHIEILNSELGLLLNLSESEKQMDLEEFQQEYDEVLQFHNKNIDEAVSTN